MIIGSHSIIYSKNAEADRKFLSDVLKLPSIDVGDGWLIFGLPPSEVAFHPSKVNGRHEFYLLCDDVKEFVRSMKENNIRCAKIAKQPWGLLTGVELPGGGILGVYEPGHPRPKPIIPGRKGTKV